MKLTLLIVAIIPMAFASAATSSDELEVCNRTIGGVNFKQTNEEARKIVESQLPYPVRASHENTYPEIGPILIFNSNVASENLRKHSVSTDGAATLLFHREKGFGKIQFMNHVNVYTGETLSWNLIDTPYENYYRDQWAMHCAESSTHRYTGNAKEASYTLANGDYLGVQCGKYSVRIKQRSVEKNGPNSYSCQYYLSFPSGEYTLDAQGNALGSGTRQEEEFLSIRGNFTMLGLHYVALKPLPELPAKGLGAKGARRQ